MRVPFLGAGYANDAVNSMRCQVLYFIFEKKEKKKKGRKNVEVIEYIFVRHITS